MSDLISRQDAIEAIASRDETDGTVKVFTGREVNEILSALSSAESREYGVLCALADRECPFQGKEFAWCLTCPHISEEDRELVRKAVEGSESKTGECKDCTHWDKLDYEAPRQGWCYQFEEFTDADEYCSRCAKMGGD